MYIIRSIIIHNFRIYQFEELNKKIEKISNKKKSKKKSISRILLQKRFSKYFHHIFISTGKKKHHTIEIYLNT